MYSSVAQKGETLLFDRQTELADFSKAESTRRSDLASVRHVLAWGRSVKPTSCLARSVIFRQITNRKTTPYVQLGCGASRDRAVSRSCSIAEHMSDAVISSFVSPSSLRCSRSAKRELLRRIRLLAADPAFLPASSGVCFRSVGRVICCLARGHSSHSC